MSEEGGVESNGRSFQRWRRGTNEMHSSLRSWTRDAEILMCTSAQTAESSVCGKSAQIQRERLMRVWRRSGQCVEMQVETFYEVS